MSAGVRVEWDRRFWARYLRSEQVRSALQSAAGRIAAEADGRVGAPTRGQRLRNSNFAASVVTRHGASSEYLVGLVIAANPRSNWKALHDGALRP